MSPLRIHINVLFTSPKIDLFPAGRDRMYPTAVRTISPSEDAKALVKIEGLL
jgi:hypothetical protein